MPLISHRPWGLTQLARGALATVLLGAAALAAAGCGSSWASTSARAPELVFGVRGRQPGWLEKPRAAALDAHDNLYLADLTDRIQVFAPTGEFIRGWAMADFNVDGPSGLSFDRQGRLMVADTHFYRVLIESPDGQVLQTIGTGVQSEAPGQFQYVTHVVQDRHGFLYTSEYGAFDRIQKFTPDGRFIRQWGGHGHAPGEFIRPQKMAFDRDDHLYVADSCNHRIEVFDTDGHLLPGGVWGEYGAGPGQMNYPYDLAFGPDGSLYVCEFGNSRVQKFTPGGKSLGTWGRPGRGPGELFNPWALVVDSRGRVVVIDSGNYRVQRVRF